MIFYPEFGLIPNRTDNVPRTMRIVKWEKRWVPIPESNPEDADEPVFEALTVVPIVWEWELLQQEVRFQSAADYASGKSTYKYRWVPTAIYEVPISRLVYHTNQPDDEPEELRRQRIRALRLATHVDPEKGAAEPKWCERVTPQ